MNGIRLWWRMRLSERQCLFLVISKRPIKPVNLISLWIRINSMALKKNINSSYQVSSWTNGWQNSKQFRSWGSSMNSIHLVSKYLSFWMSNIARIYGEWVSELIQSTKFGVNSTWASTTRKLMISSFGIVSLQKSKSITFTRKKFGS